MENPLWVIGDSNQSTEFTGNMIANIAKSLMGAGIGVGIAHALGKNKLLVLDTSNGKYEVVEMEKETGVLGTPVFGFADYSISTISSFSSLRRTR